MALKDKAGMAGIGKVPLVLFIMLTIAGASIFAVARQDAPSGSVNDAVVDAGGVLESLLASTIDEVRYTDVSGRTHIYTGWTIHELMVEDLELRSDDDTPANITSLEKGIEAAVNAKLDALSGEHHYNLKASYGGVFFRIKDLAIEGKATSTTTIHMRSIDGDAKVLLSMTE